jgi:hypothetical protein
LVRIRAVYCTKHTVWHGYWLMDEKFMLGAMIHRHLPSLDRRFATFFQWPFTIWSFAGSYISEGPQ